MRTGLVITGLLIFLLALIGSIVLLVVGFVTFESPDKDPYLEFDSNGNYYMKEGDYLVWSDEEDVNMVITDQYGSDVEIKSDDMQLEISGYHYIGTISIDSDGNYFFSDDSNTATIYVTEADQGIQSPIGILGCGCCCGLIFVPLGLILLIIGLLAKKK
jgi:hypothetical protein